MSSGIEQLKDIGAQKIHENTHISKLHIQALLHDSFEGMTKVQFLGFISILERDYGIELNDLKAKGLEYFKETDIDEKDNSKIFIEPKKPKNYTKIYIAIVVLIFVFVAIYKNSLSWNGDANTKQVIDNGAINHAKKSMIIVQETQELNSSIAENNVTIEEPIVEEVQDVVKLFKVIPNAKLWMGYIDLETYKKHQKIFRDEFSIDPDKEWLLSLGHGNVSFDINGEIIKFNSRKNMRFIYKDGELKEINFQEFKRLNRGNEW
ncbi:MAG: hypothetical protein U9Q29_03235 [Campylobacterota bacterium]|nr:hypothetical protein [Campylobacterota bacterium]